MDHKVAWTAGIAVVVVVGLACAGGSSGGLGGGSGFTGGGGTNGYGDIPWTRWEVKAADYTWDMNFDRDKTVSGWLGEEAVPFESSSSSVHASFAEGAVDLEVLDACTLAGTGPHPHKADRGPLTYRMDRQWPPCGPETCTYADLRYTTWHIYAEDYHWYVTFGEDGELVSDWLSDKPTPYRQSGGRVTATTPRGPLELERLDRCHWAGKGPHPRKEAKDGVTLTYRLERAWPSCGC